MIPKTKDIVDFSPESVAHLREILEKIQRAALNSNGDTLKGNLTMGDSFNIPVGTTTGTKIGTATSQKLAFYGVTPVDQPATIADPTGGATVDAEARTAINSLIDRLQELGLIA